MASFSPGSEALAYSFMKVVEKTLLSIDEMQGAFGKQRVAVAPELS
jgi:hypothetical protein